MWEDLCDGLISVTLRGRHVIHLLTADELDVWRHSGTPGGKSQKMWILHNVALTSQRYKTQSHYVIFDRSRPASACSRRLMSRTHPAPVQSPGQVVTGPQRKDGHGGWRTELQLVQHWQDPAHLNTHTHTNMHHKHASLSQRLFEIDWNILSACGFNGKLISHKQNKVSIREGGRTHSVWSAGASL